MDLNQKITADLLSAAMGFREPLEVNTAGADWEKIFEYAKAHQVYMLMYPSVKKLFRQGKGPGAEFMAMWEKNSLIAGIVQLQHIEETGNILNTLHESGIPVIALKGLVIRDCYAQPELRSMSDADIFVSPEYFDKAAELIQKNGFGETERDQKHIRFYDNQSLAVELHYKIAKGHFSGYAETWEDALWTNAMPVKICNASALSMSPADQLIHLLLHMAGHFINCGFGLRQLCDLCVFIKAKKDVIDWELVHKHINGFELYGFTRFTFNACQRLFGVQLPLGIEFINVSDFEKIDAFIQDIFAAGVFGNGTMDRRVGALLVKKINFEKIKAIPGRFQRLRLFLFPKAESLGNRYSYAVKHHVLIPFAWIHRIFFSLIRKDVSVSYKSSFLQSLVLQGKHDERYKMLKWMGFV